jgi:hypothetical protein
MNQNICKRTVCNKRRKITAYRFWRIWIFESKMSSIYNRRHKKIGDFHLETTRNAVRHSDILKNEPFVCLTQSWLLLTVTLRNDTFLQTFFLITLRPHLSKPGGQAHCSLTSGWPHLYVLQPRNFNTHVLYTCPGIAVLPYNALKPHTDRRHTILSVSSYHAASVGSSYWV